MSAESVTTSELAVDADVRDLIDTVLSDHDCNGPVQAQQHRRDAVDDELWRRLDDLGLSRLTAAEDRGGSGAGWPAGAALVTALARRGCWLPVGDSDLVAEWLLAQVGIAPGPGLHAWFPDDGQQLRSHAVHPAAESVVVLRDLDGSAEVALLDTAAVDRRVQSGGWPDDVRWTAASPDLMRHAEARSALIRALQVVGAMESAVELAIGHATEREQFGRPIAKFQAVQGHLSTIAAETALARAATDSAVLEMALHGDRWERVLPSIAVARSCVGHAAAVVARRSHQVIGAIGTTQEHRLHRHTTAMLAWRSEHGDTRSWDRCVLDLVVDHERLSDLDFDHYHAQSIHSGEKS